MDLSCFIKLVLSNWFLWTTEIDGKNLSMRAELARPDDDESYVLLWRQS